MNQRYDCGAFSVKTVEPGRQIVFPPFRLDTASERLWRDQRAIRLQPKVFALLQYLAERPGRLVTKSELLEALWPETTVTEGVLKACIKTLRDALEDEPGHPRFIETAHRRGYRFIALLDAASAVPQPPAGLGEAGTPLVGREEEMAALRLRLEAALRGERQLVFVTGEPGIGKTTLVEAFLHRAAEAGAAVAHGACLEQYGGSDAYLPWLDALSELIAQGNVASLIRHAPAWLAQLPALAAAGQASPERAIGTSREHLVREMARLLEALAEEKPLAILLEDLHWSDYSSLDLLSYLARRRERARLLLIGTFRPVDVILGDHPLKGVKAELEAHRFCTELPLAFLAEPAVAEYLAARLPGRLPAGLARFVHQRSEGNPLFIVNVVDDLLARGAVVQAGDRWELVDPAALKEARIPEGVLQLIERMVDRLRPEERRLLEAGSVAGVEFTVAAVAAALGAEAIEVEDACEALSRRRQFLAGGDQAELPAGTPSACYRFIHALYQNALYGRLPAGRRADLHRRIGEQREAAFGPRAAEVALELGHHFEQGREPERAVHYVRGAAESARLRFANNEAVALARRGLALLAGLPEGARRDEEELQLQLTLGRSLVNTIAFSAPETEGSMRRALELCHRLGDPPELAVAMLGSWMHHLIAGEMAAARRFAEELSRLARQAPDDRLLLLAAHTACAYTAMWAGDFSEAEARMTSALALCDPDQRRAFFARFALEPAVYLLSLRARTLWLLGYPAQARQQMEQALVAAEEAGDPRSRIYASISAAGVRRHLGEPQEALELAERCFALCQEHGVSQERGWASALRSLALLGTGCVDEGLAGLREAVAHLRGLQQDSPGLTTALADGLRRAGQREEALAAVEEALAAVERTGERFWEAEVHRLKGELLLAAGEPSASQAEACFRHALAIAGRQQARSLELRAAMSLSRLMLQRGQREGARQTLEDRYGWFTEGRETRDLRAAAALLAEVV